VKGHAEIVGGGLGGMAAALALARRGWSVRVHEQASELREIGAGLYLKENGLRALDDMGISGSALAGGVRLAEMDIVDTASGRTFRRDAQQIRVYVVLRTDLHRAMASAATAAGVEVVTSSRGVAASADGRLTVSGSGQDLKADLVIGADGVNSAIRESLGLAIAVKTLPEGATRLLIPRLPGERESHSTEYWSGRNRLLVTPCSPEHLYIALMAPEADQQASAIPVDIARWTDSFPGHSALLRRIDSDTATHRTNAYVMVRGWTSGRACILGDAAHGQPPNLGQGAGLTIFNAVELAASLEKAGSVEEGLAGWQARWLPVASMVQKWSYWYGVLAYRWPQPLGRARLSALRTLTTFGPTRRRYTWLWQGGLDDVRAVPFETHRPQAGSAAR
jgi:2-polyprenyl-6-methoxyphenol hydroxylase-like FAD-dependent oxidoreductase